MKININYKNLNFLDALTLWLVKNDFLDEAQVVNSQSINEKRIVPLKELRIAYKRDDLVTVYHKTLKDRVFIGLDKSSRNTHIVSVYFSNFQSGIVALCDQLYNLSPGDCEYGEITTLGVQQIRALRRNHRVYNFSEELGLGCPWYLIVNEEIFDIHFDRPNERIPVFKLESKFEGSYSIQFWESHDQITTDTEKRIKDIYEYLNPKKSNVVNTKNMTPPLLNYTEIISAHFENLEKLLGTPGVGDESKTDAWWVFQLEDGTKGEIHNYKGGKNYLGDEGTANKDIICWTIRAVNKAEMNRLCEFLRVSKVLIE